jgi:hypothetical protein
VCGGDDVSEGYKSELKQQARNGNNQVQEVLNPSETEMVLVVDRVVGGVLEDAQPVRSLESLLQHGTATTAAATAAETTALLPDPATIMAALRDSDGVLDSWGAFFAYQEAARSGPLHGGGTDDGDHGGEETPTIDSDGDGGGGGGQRTRVSPEQAALEIRTDDQHSGSAAWETR